LNLYYPSHLDVTSVVIVITQGLGSGGAPSVVETKTTKCNFSEKSKIKYSSEGESTRIVGSLTFRGDVASSTPILAGNVTINGAVFKIFSGSRVRNPDGTINHVKLELQ